MPGPRFDQQSWQQQQQPRVHRGTQPALFLRKQSVNSGRKPHVAALELPAWSAAASLGTFVCSYIY
jgi:hypothetical protein